MWKIQTPPLIKVVYIWNVYNFDFGFDPPPPYGLFPQFVTFSVWKAPLILSLAQLSPSLYCQTPDLGQGLEFDFTFAM